MKLAVAVALLGMVCVAAAVDVETQKKKYDSYDDKPEYKGEYEKKEYYDKSKEYKGDYEKKDYGYDHHHHANVHASHKHWNLNELAGQTHPCDPLYEILGSTVTYSAALSNDAGKGVGSVWWSGIVVAQDECKHCGTSLGHHVVRVNYEVIFEFTAMHVGQLIAKATGDSVFSTAPTTLAVLGGTGAYEGAWGTVVWTSTGEKTGHYEFNIQLPTVESSDYGYKSGEDYKSYKDSEEYKY